MLSSFAYDSFVRRVKLRNFILEYKVKMCLLYRDSPKISSREKVHVIETSSCQTVQDIAVRMHHAAKQEKDDPVNDAHDSSEVEDSKLNDHDLPKDGDVQDSTGSEVKPFSSLDNNDKCQPSLKSFHQDYNLYGTHISFDINLDRK